MRRAGFEEATCPYKARAQAKPGPYAIALFHDGNGKLDRNFIGLPNEPFGFSNDAGRRGPPNFEAARVVVKEPSTTIVISVR